jgi:hypothetical protein
MLLEGPGKTWGLSLLCRSQTLAIKTFCTSALERTNVAFPNPGKFHTTISRTDDGDWPYATATCSLERPSHLSYRTTHGRPSITPTAMQSATVHLRHFPLISIARQAVKPCTGLLQPPLSPLQRTSNLGVLTSPQGAVGQRYIAKICL